MSRDSSVPSKNRDSSVPSMNRGQSSFLQRHSSAELSSVRSSSGSIADEMVESSMKARRKLDRKLKADKNKTDKYFSYYLTLRSEPVTSFLRLATPKSELPISSINEDRMLKELGVRVSERNLIEGLALGSGSNAGIGLTEEQQTSQAIVRLAANPTPEVMEMQRRTMTRMLRPYPLGLRFSGKNMSPQPCWLGGAQHVCLNFSDSDLSVQLHFALFNGHGGFVLKPKEMRLGFSRHTSTEDSTQDDKHFDDDCGWPPPRKHLQCVTLQIASLHSLPRRGERRPRFDGTRRACHLYHPELSGVSAPPNGLNPSNPSFSVSLHPIGGICALSRSLPFNDNMETELTIRSKDNGMNAEIGQDVHCMAAEPHTTFLRVSVVDGRQGEVAFETCVLGRLRGGYRILKLRSMLGTRIELACLFVRISFGVESNMWLTLRQLGMQGSYRSSRRKTSAESEQRELRDGSMQSVGDSVDRVVVELSKAAIRNTSNPLR